MYLRLTKRITTPDGADVIVCSNYGTEKCRVHNCSECQMIAQMINMLYEFENIMEDDEFESIQGE